MRRRREICGSCMFLFNGAGEGGRRYAFCMNTDLHGSSAFYEAVAKANPANCPEDEFFGSEHDEDVFSECPYKAEYCLMEWNNEKKN